MSPSSQTDVPWGHEQGSVGSRNWLKGWPTAAYVLGALVSTAEDLAVFTDTLFGARVVGACGRVYRLYRHCHAPGQPRHRVIGNLSVFDVEELLSELYPPA